MSDIKKKTVLDSFFMIVNSGFSQILQTVKGIIVSKFLGPVNLGIWSNLMLIVSYADFLQLGTLQVLTRDYPREKAKGNEEECQKLVDTNFTYHIIIGLIFFLGIIIYTFIFFNSITPVFRWGLLTIGFLFLLMRIYEFISRTIRAFDKIKEIMVSGIVFSICIVITGIILTYYFQLYGLFLSMLITYIISIIFILIYVPFKFKFDFDTKKIGYIIIAGLPIMLVNFFYSLVRSIDKVFILAFLNHEDLGYYHFSIMITGFFMMVPFAIASQMFPKLSFKFGSVTDKKQMFNFVFKPTLGLSYFEFFITGYGLIGVPFLINLFLPEYRESIPPFEIISVGLFFLSISGIIGNFLIVIHRQNDILKVSIATLIICLITDYVFLKLGYGISGVALGTSITYVFYGLGVIFYGMKNVTDDFKIIFRSISKISVPMLLCFAGVLMYYGIEKYFCLNGNLIYLQRFVIFSIVALPTGAYYYFKHYRHEMK